MTMKGTCKNPDCTVSETGICLEAHDDLQECPHFVIDEIENRKDVAEDSEPQDPSEATDNVRVFHSGNELGIGDAAELMRKTYVHLIGIIGFYNAGKTCFLSSLYLLATRGSLMPDYLFAGSYSLKGFEDRVRGLRRWQEALPDKLVEHTSVQDPRNPALMHLGLREYETKRTHELLLTDLPGEWFRDLVDHADVAERFNFLKRADGLIFVIDGHKLNDISQRNLEIHRSRSLLERLVYNVGIDAIVPLVLFVSKCDLIDMREPAGITDIVNSAREMNFQPNVVLGSSFSANASVTPSGTGVIQSIDNILKFKTPPSNRIRHSELSTRAFRRYRFLGKSIS